MVLCKFFQQGSCRFGSKCNNEHFDVKQVIKTDVEGAINGKQWPLSSYGPFKDKPSIPNFIEDQSFEEIRLLCYEAKQKNFFDQFHQQFTKEAMEASNKMKALLQMTPEIVDVVINVYDTPSDTSCNGVTVPGNTSNSVSSSNPFGMGNTAVTTAASIFAKPQTAQTANSIFGGGTAVGGSGFGSVNTSASSIFGAAAATTQPSSNLFGNAASFSQQPQQQSSMFAQPAKSTNSIFGGGSMGGNLFTQPGQQQQQQQPQPGFGLFSQQQQPQQQSSIFGQQQQPQNTSVFGPTPLSQTSNPFLQAAQQPPPPQQQGLFAHAAQSMQQPPQQAQGIFAQAAQQTMPQQTATNQGLFAQAAQQTQNIFGQAMQQPQQNPTNIFQQPQQTPNQQQSQAQPAAFQQNILQNQNPAVNNNPSSLVSSTLYSRMEDLTPDEIEAFKADCFLPGKIPFNPPPRELIH